MGITKRRGESKIAELSRLRDALLDEMRILDPVPGGNQIFDDGDGHVELELRTCKCCGSTLGVFVSGRLH